MGDALEDAPAEERRILDMIGSTPASKSLAYVKMPIKSIRAAAGALMGPNATHALKALAVDRSYFVGNVSEDAADSIWSLLVIPTLEHFDVDSRPEYVLSDAQIDIQRDGLRSRRRSGHPSLRSIGFFGSIGYFYDLFCTEPTDDIQYVRYVGEQLQEAWVVIKEESPSTESFVDDERLEDVFERLIDWANEHEDEDLEE